MYNPSTGNVTCSRCGALIGNIDGGKNYFALIATKWCPTCKEPARKESLRMAQKAWRKRKKENQKLTKKRDELLKEENEKLRQQIAELRSRLGE